MIEKKVPRDHQIADLAFYIATKRCLNLSDPACQKTGSACMYIWYLWSVLKVKTAFVMPMSLLRKNKDELLEFTNFKPEEIQIIDGDTKRRDNQMRNPNAKVFLMGFQRFSDEWQKMKGLHSELDACVVDELHLGYAGYNAKRTTNWILAMRQITYYLGMTGTIIKGNIGSAYPTIEVIEPRFYGSYGGFLAYHRLQDEYGTTIGWTNHDKLAQILARVAVRHTFTEVHGEEAKVIVTELCDMSPKQRKAYEEMEDEALVELTDEFLEGATPAVNAMRCRQIMSHPETFGIAKGEKTGKDERLIIHLADAVQSGEPIAIFAALIPEMERIVALAKSMGLRTALINGNVSSSRRAAIDQAFRAGQLDCVVASPDTAGVGFNWHHLSVMVFTSLNYMDDSFVQAYRRGIRGARTSALLIYVLEYRDSIDQRIMQIIEQKSREAHKVDPTKEIFKLSEQRRQEEVELFDKSKATARKIAMADFM
jgi:SNF2 family DNA or RNA helicase